MTRANEKAMEEFPIVGDLHLRDAYISGYKQAEKDLALTWKDIQKILDLDDYFITDRLVRTGMLPNKSRAYCNRILTDFKKYKNTI